MQPFVLAAELERRYADYIRTSFPFADRTLREQIDEKIRDEHLLASGPIVSLQRAFESGPTVEQLRASGLLHDDVAAIFRNWILHRHQADALERLSDRTGHARSTIVATGTGSGKTEAFLLPILDYCARNRGDGVKALLVYPMNALANDQLNRLRMYLSGTGITFGRYTGDTRESDGQGRPDEAPPEECWSRQAIRERRPNLLITSYRMLEYLLVRRQDQPIFRPGGAAASLRYLVLDEVHTYDGALGAEVACLIRRLRGHLDLGGSSLVCVGTSATVGNEEGDGVCTFASDLFADTIDRDGLIEERYVDEPPPPLRLARPAALTDDELAAIERLAEREADRALDFEPALESALRSLLSEREWSASWPDFERELFDALHDHPTLRWLQHAFRTPARLDAVVIASLSVPGREGSTRAAAEREIASLLTLGTVARDAEGALLRPRLHALFRGLARTTRCIRCGELQVNGDQTCAACHARALPLEICRVCGQDYLRTAPVDPTGSLSEGLLTRVETDDEMRPTGPAVLRLAREYHKFSDAADADEGELEGGDASPPPSHAQPSRIAYCADCGFARDPAEGPDAAALSPCPHCGNTHVVTPLLAGVGPLMTCPNCRHRYGSLEPITSLFSSTAVGVSILTWILMGRLPEPERRLLIFADSRQDTAYQAGYLADVTAEYAWRQVVYRMIRERAGQDDVPYDFSGFWKRIYQYGLDNYGIFSRDDREQQINDLRWFLLKEFGRESDRRNALEQLGLVTCTYRGLEDVDRSADLFSAFSRAARAVPARKAFSADDFRALLLGILDVIRRAGAISDDFALKFWGQSEPLRGLDDINRRPVLFRKFGGKKSGYVTVRPVAGKSARRTAVEELLARAGVEDPRAAAAAATELLLDCGLLTKLKAGGPQAFQREEGLMVNVGRIELTVPSALWQCTNCRMLSPRQFLGLCRAMGCPDWRQPSLRPYQGTLSDENFYAGMYASFDPIRIEAKEHSGQISGDRRMEYEEQFRSGKINVLVASPTLELGVDIGALSTVLLRGLPPSPANYAQRAGRAGRRERIALVNSYAQASPHDSYFYRFPERMVSGTIGVPSFDLDNQEIVRRHVRALALEKLAAPLPAYMRDFLDISDVDNPSPEQLVTSTVAGAVQSMAELAAKRDAIIAAVATVFAADKREWLSEGYVRDVLQSFESDLMRVLDRWHGEVVDVAREIGRINKIANPSPEEKRRRQQFERTLGALTRRSGVPGSGGTSDSYTLGYLSSHGFLPSYAFPGEAATLFAPEIDGGEVVREPSIALSEFAPENIVYVDGRKVRCDGVTLRSASAASTGADPHSYVACGICGHLASSAWVGSCPGCKSLDSAAVHARVEPTIYRGHQFERISAGEDARERRIYEVRPGLLDDAEYAERFDYATCTVTLRRRQPLMNVNHGRIVDGVTRPFEMCAECGDVKPTRITGDWIAQHRKRRGHEPRLEAVQLTNTLRSDVVIVEPAGLPEIASLTLRYALLAAATIEFDAGERELDGFEERAPSGGPRTILYERIAGGVGYIRRFPITMPRLASRALEILQHDPPCAKACYLCLCTYYNQRDHSRIDRGLVIDFLEALSKETAVTGTPIAETGPLPAGPPADTDWEIALLRGLEARGLRGAQTQYEIHEPSDNRLVSKPDIAFPRERIAIYADGAAHHASPEDRANDLRIRTRVQELGWRVRAYPNSRITADLQGCVDDVQRLIEQL